MWRSSDFIVNNGVIDGNNSPTSTAVQVEASKEGVRGGSVLNVEARNT